MGALLAGFKTLGSRVTFLLWRHRRRIVAIRQSLYFTATCANACDGACASVVDSRVPAV